MISVRKVAIGVPILVVSGIAGQQIFSSKVTGDMVAANWSGPNGSVDVNPVDTPDGRAYAVFWRGCTLNPDFEHRFCLSGGGLAPRSAIRAQQAGSLGVQLDLSALSVVFTTTGEDCLSGTCVFFVPPSVPLHGTFTILQGPGSNVEQFDGRSSQEAILPFGGVTLSQSFSGNQTRYSAIFTGVVGPIVVAPPPSGFNAQVTVMKGQRTFRTVYPAP